MIGCCTKAYSYYMTGLETESHCSSSCSATKVCLFHTHNLPSVDRDTSGIKCKKRALDGAPDKNAVPVDESFDDMCIFYM